jgi:hypothetical protein
MYHLSLFVWAAVLLGVSVRVGVSSRWAQTVVPIYRHAGERWAAGEDVYAPTPGFDVFRNPPPVAALFAPLARLPETPAAILWRLAGAAVLLAGLRGLVRAAGLTEPWRVGLVFAITAELALPSINNGQVNVHLIGAVLCGTVAAVGGRSWTAAAWLAAAAWMKGYPLAAGLLVGVAVPAVGWRIVLLTAAVFAGTFVCQEPGYVWAEYRSWVELIGLDDRTFAPAHRFPRDWRVVPRMWLDCVIPCAVAGRVGVLAGAGMAVAVWRARRAVGPGPAAVTAAGLAAVWMTLFGPATEDVTYTLLAPAAGLAVGRWTGRDRPEATVAAWAAYLLLLAPVLRGLFPSGEVFPVRTAQPVGAAVLLVLLLCEALASGGRQPPVPAISPRPDARTGG